jgi:hypothetical protein
MQTFKLRNGRTVTEDDILRYPQLRRQVVEEIDPKETPTLAESKGVKDDKK